MRRLWSILSVILFVLPTAAWGGPSRGGQPERLERALARVPRSAEMVIVIDDLASARRLKAGAKAMDLVADSTLLGDARGNWGALAGLLGWNEDETLDRLLGSRVVLAIAGDGAGAGGVVGGAGGQEPPWALLSEISNETHARIRDRIPIAPRKAVEGMPIFALERGEYELAMARVKDDGGVERMMLLVGPARRAALFDVMARALARGIPDGLDTTPVAREMPGLDGPGVLVAVRVEGEAPAEGAAPGWGDFLVCSASPKDAAWECRLTLRDASVRDRVNRLDAWSDAPFRAMSKHAMLAVLETRLSSGPGQEQGGNFFERLLAVFALPEGSAEILTGRQALGVWPRAGAAAGGKGVEELCVAVAMETSDVQRMAPLGDRHLGELLVRVESVLGGSGNPVPDFGGISCQAVRSVPMDIPATGKLARVFGGQPRLAWSYPVSSENDDASRGWWQVCVTGTGDGDAGAAGCGPGGGECASASRRMVNALVGGGEGETDRWVSVGVARPSMWTSIIRDVMAGGGASPEDRESVAKLVGRVSYLSWRLRAGKNGDVVGTLRVEME